MKVLHAIIALVFIFVGASIWTSSEEAIPALLALLVSNVSLAAIGIERALDKTPIERPPVVPDPPGPGATRGTREP